MTRYQTTKYYIRLIWSIRPKQHNQNKIRSMKVSRTMEIWIFTEILLHKNYQKIYFVQTEISVQNLQTNSKFTVNKQPINKYQQHHSSNINKTQQNSTQYWQNSTNFDKNKSNSKLSFEIINIEISPKFSNTCRLTLQKWT